MSGIRTYIAPAAMGLGDLVVTLPIVQALIEQGTDVYLVLRMLEHAPLAERVPGLAGYVFEWDLKDGEMADDDARFIDLRDHDLQREGWWGSPEFEHAHPGLLINDILHKICWDKGIAVDFEQHVPLSYEVRDELEQVIALVPGSAVSSKCWEIESWLKLASAVKSFGFTPLVIGQPQSSKAVKDLVSHGLNWLRTPTIADAIDVLSSCFATVSVDTGLMHIAAHQGRPTVGIFKQGSTYLRPMPNFRALTAQKPCLPACHQEQERCAHHSRPSAGSGFQPADWECTATAGQHCLSTIKPQMVLDALLKVMPRPLLHASRQRGHRHQRTNIAR